jgi:hypothetical protein
VLNKGVHLLKRGLEKVLQKKLDWDHEYSVITKDIKIKMAVRTPIPISQPLASGTISG